MMTTMPEPPGPDALPAVPPPPPPPELAFPAAVKLPAPLPPPLELKPKVPLLSEPQAPQHPGIPQSAAPTVPPRPPAPPNCPRCPPMPPFAVTTAPMLDVPPVLPSDDVPAGIDAPPAPMVMLWPAIAATGTTFHATPPSP